MEPELKLKLEISLKLIPELKSELEFKHYLTPKLEPELLEIELSFE